MCGPAVLPMLTTAMAGMTTTTAMMIGGGLGLAQWSMEEKRLKAARDSSRRSLKIAIGGENIRQQEEMTAAQVESLNISRKARISAGQLSVIGASRGTARSNAAAQAQNEFAAMEGEYQGAVAAKRQQQALMGGMRDAGAVAQYQNRMVANASSGLMGAVLATAGGAMSMAGVGTAASAFPNIPLGNVLPDDAFNVIGFNPGSGFNEVWAD
jgi:hypothetical protein